MQARAPLMIEHRLIERMIEIIKRMLHKVEIEKSVDPLLVDKTIDFIRIYADKTHHGKEENILFRALEKKDLSEKDQVLMEELISEHILGRETTKKLVEANDRYRNGNKSALSEIISNLGFLIDFYPTHIEKEDKVFFPSARKYFSEEEDQAMLEEFWEFDRQMIHEKYRSVIETFEA
ncbi:hemerythrin HHE cation binding domain protein [delta proteobacterium NaphS2]|nr:hemerythrin HHE cation binding domain protein [delta proteobacterium NaphS2]